MRNFERQADLFAAVTMGSAVPVIRSLEKIAIAGGKIRDLPSWHHFSIRERVDCLEGAERDPSVVKRHNHYLAVSLGIYLVGILSFGWFFNFSDFKDIMAYSLIEKQLQKKIEDKPQNALLYANLAEIYHHFGKYDKAIHAYEKSLSLEPNNAVALNNLAWLLLTASDKSYRDYTRGLDLAEKAVHLEREPSFLDTLAEARYINGDFDRALELIEEALAKDPRNREYYASQRDRFLDGNEAKRP